MSTAPDEGGVYFLRAVPDPQGKNAKDRWVVVFRAVVPGYSAALCVAVSSTTTAADRVALPNEEQDARSRSGLPRMSYAVPAWVLLVSHADLSDKRGSLFGPTLLKLKQAIARASDEGRTTMQRAPEDL